MDVSAGWAGADGDEEGGSGSTDSGSPRTPRTPRGTPLREGFSFTRKQVSQRGPLARPHTWRYPPLLLTAVRDESAAGFTEREKRPLCGCLMHHRLCGCLSRWLGRRCARCQSICSRSISSLQRLSVRHRHPQMANRPPCGHSLICDLPMVCFLVLGLQVPAARRSSYRCGCYIILEASASYY
eukprot:COSAG06_NODE_3100_length_5860_cov_286.024996_2_plen_183_part_00